MIYKIQDLTEYNPRSVSTRVLLDDLRMLYAWYATAKKNEDFKHTKQQIIDTYKKALEEAVKRGVTIHYGELRNSSKELFELANVDVPDNQLVKGIKQVFGSPGGSLSQAVKIKRYLNKINYKWYVEPFCGGAAVFFSLDEKPENAVLNDIDNDIIFMYRYIQENKDASNLKRFNWRGSQALYEKLCKKYETRNFSNDHDRFYTLYTLKRISYANSMRDFDKRYVNVDIFEKAGMEKAFERWKERLDGAHLSCDDAIKVIKKYDKNKDVVFFVDPPYITKSQKGFKSKYTEEDYEKLINALDNLNNKFLLTVATDMDVRGNWHTTKLKTRHSIADGGGDKFRYETLAANTVLKTREEQREQLAEEIGDYYMVEQPKGKKFDSVIQYHLRGIWSNRRCKQLKEWFKSLKKGNIPRELKGDDIEAIYKQIWTKYDCEYLTGSLEDMSKEATRVDDRRGDVTRAIDKFLNRNAPDLDELDIAKIVNRGNAHSDWRNLAPNGEYLIGWTNNVVKVCIQDLDDNIFYPLRDRILENEEGDNWLCEKKALQPLAWLTLVTPDEPVYEAEPEQVGATRETAGRFYLMARAKVEYGVQKTDFHEYFYEFIRVYDNKHFKSEKELSGRWDFKLIPSSKEYAKAPEDEFWMGNRPTIQLPYSATHDKEEEEEKAKKEGIEIIWNAIKSSILKVDKKHRIIKGPFLVPGEVDAQGDIITPEQVEQAFYRYAKRHRKYVSIMHDRKTFNRGGNEVVELWLTEEPRMWQGARLPAKTGMVGVYLGNDKDWHDAQVGKLGGFSIGGAGIRYVRKN